MCENIHKCVLIRYLWAYRTQLWYCPYLTWSKTGPQRTANRIWLDKMCDNTLARLNAFEKLRQLESWSLLIVHMKNFTFALFYTWLRVNYDKIGLNSETDISGHSLIAQQSNLAAQRRIERVNLVEVYRYYNFELYTWFKLISIDYGSL